MTANSNTIVGGLLLAAGGSSRMGRPKQMLEFEGRTLISRAAESLATSLCDPVLVVLGGESRHSKTELAGLDVNIFVNCDWQAGMSSSIKTGLTQLLTITPNLAAVIITLCDQPFVTTANINLFIDEFNQHHSPIIAAAYADTIGVPALFSPKMFDDLLNLKGDKGAREIIRSHHNDVQKIQLEEAAFDIDRLDDVQPIIKILSRIELESK